jgi:hypothetical protein
MVAKAAWLTIEPEISLEGFLASEEIEFFQPSLSWMPQDWTHETRETANFESHDSKS